MWTSQLSMGDGTRGLTESQSLLVILICMYGLTVVTQAQEYKWHTSAWDECYKRTGCGDGGIQVRRVTCKIFYNGVYSSTHTSNCKYIQKPIERQSCFKLCNEHQYQIRWAWDPWSECQLEPGASSCAKGRGVQYRRVSCVWKDDGKKEDDSVCSEFEPKPASQQRCELRCPQDCVVTKFTDWSDCDNCRYLNKTRTRTILIPNNNGGRICPPFSQLLPCEECAGTYFLSVQKWSRCESFSSDQQAIHPLIGHQKRNIKCINALGTMVNHQRCKKQGGFKHIERHQACIIPKDCFVSEWSSWDRINSSCIDFTGSTQVGLIKRYRKVIQLPVGNGKACSPLEEVTEVQGTAQRKCPRARWIVSSWSTCLPVNSLKQCSTGLQHRIAVCVEENFESLQKPVPNHFCTDERPLTSQTCRADCQWDCTVSLWSSWSECKVTDCEQYARKRRNNLKTGQRYRTREILTLPGSEGKACDHLSETQNCDPEPCYNWQVNTGPCILSNANIGLSCGKGTAHRTRACLNKFQLRVGGSLCREFREPPALEVDCEIPCPSDCVISNWGEWSECPDRCQRGQIQQRATKTRKRTILARAFAGGRECPTPRYMEQTVDCPTLIECDIFMWRVDPWSICQLEDPNKPCGRGTQQRNVNCYDSNRQVVSDEKCTEKVTPRKQKDCTVACPQDCIVTNWSDWSDCSASCWEVLAKDVSVPTRTRQRYILQQPTNNGSPCPEKLSDTQRCVNLPLCNQFTWEMSEWSECVLPPVVKQCGQGLRARNVTCKSENSTVHPIDVCLRYAGAMPRLYEICYESCEQNCLFSDWSAWSTCIGGCNGKQFRDRQLVSGSGGKSGPSICSNLQLYPRYEQQQCFCKSLQRVVIGEWSQCILMPMTRSSSLRNSMRLIRNATGTTEIGVSCGTGKRYKVVACKNSLNAIETAKKCTVEGKDSEEEVCVIPCPVDCEMSQWSQWSRCPTSCGAGVQERYRHIRQLPSAGGRRCPSLDSTSKEVQTRLCHPECVQYTWKITDWSMCIPEKGRRCGDGQQTRHVRCKAVNIYGITTKAAGDENCAGLPRPQMARACFLPCHGDCVVSEWTEYTICKQPCNRNQRQVRTREVMREPGSYVQYQNECPSLKEERPCKRGDNCIEYMWEFASWTTCLVNNGLDDCGVGHKERYAICKNHFDRVVDNRMCREVHGPVTEPLVVSCEIPCDVDCLLSDWSPWSSCSKSCGLGFKKRDRSVVQQYIGNGRPCPPVGSLSQTMQCFARGCFTWKLSDWSPCATQKGVCGFGIQKRNITCLGDNGQPVDSSRCPPDLAIMVSLKEQECHIPCPGECVTTMWSEWSQCYIKCIDFHMGYRTGIRSRSRAILAYPGPLKDNCPDQLWTSEPCQAITCTSYNWVAGPWTDKRRNVWCERHDGLKVQGGCHRLQKPPTVLSCVQPCHELNAFCNDTDYCACSPEYFALFKDNTFIGCYMENDTVTKHSLSSEKPDDGVTNIWMYAVIAAGTIFVIFVTIALYNMSDFMHYGPRPRNRSSTNDLNTTNPNSRTSTLRNNPDSVVMMDNCDVCKHIPSPVTPQAHMDTRLPPPNDHADTKCHISVGSCVRALDNSEECSRFPDLLARICPCTKSVSMHEPDCTVVKEHDVCMTPCTNMHDSPPDESNISCTTALLDETSASKNFGKCSPVRSDSEQSGYTQYSDLTTKDNSYRHKHSSSSDSAISVSITTNSVTGTSISSSPHYKQETILKSKIPSESINNTELSECRTSSSLKSLENITGIGQLCLMNKGSFDFIMQDFTKKIDSLSRGKEPTFSANGFRDRDSDKFDSDSEEDALLGDNSCDTTFGINPPLDEDLHFETNDNQTDRNNVHVINLKDLNSSRPDVNICVNNYSKCDNDENLDNSLRNVHRQEIPNEERIPEGFPRHRQESNCASQNIPKDKYSDTDLHSSERSRPLHRGGSSRRENKPRLMRQQKLPDRYIEQSDSGNYELDNNSCSSENTSDHLVRSPKHRRFPGLQKRGNSDSGFSTRNTTGLTSKDHSHADPVTMETDDVEVFPSQDNNETSLEVNIQENDSRQWKETVL